MIEMVQAQYFVCEDAGALHVQIMRRGDTDVESSIAIKTKGMSAKEGLDYHIPPDDIIHFNPGEKDKSDSMTSRILLTFPHAENSFEINPSHMVFMFCNFAQCI